MSKKASTSPQRSSTRATKSSSQAHAAHTAPESLGGHRLCSLPTKEADELVEQLIQNLKPYNMRRTRGLVSLLMEMAVHHHPMTLQQLGEKPSLGFLDQATIYRLMMKLEEVDIVRRFSFRGRSTHFQLNIRGHQHDYLICKICERITSIEVKLPLEAVQRTVAVATGWHDIQAELEFYGVCPVCTK